MNAFDLLRPKDLGSALATLAGEAPPTIKAGGIDLLDRMKEGLDRPARLMDVRALPELRKIEVKDGLLRIGSAVTLAEVANSDLVRKHARALADAAAEAATPQVRNVATVGGNLHQHVRCWYYRSAEFEPCLMRGGKECFAKDGRNKIHAIFETDQPCVAVDPSNLAAPLVALDAKFEVRQVIDRPDEKWDSVHGGDLGGLFVRGRNTIKESTHGPGTLLAAVTLPVRPARRSIYVEFGERESFDWALASAAIALEVQGGVVREPRIALGAVSLVTWRQPAAERLLDGKKITPEHARAVAAKCVEHARPLSENGFKVQILRTLVARALTALWEEKK